MNGLKLIRTQCNISLSGLAEILGVTRQIISVWEHGKKEIPETRLEQLSEYFGIEPEFFGEITDEQKETILDKPMYIWGDDENGYYLYRRDSRNRMIHFANRERKFLPSEEFRQCKSIQKELITNINQQINGPIQRHIGEQMAATKRGIKYYDYCFENMSLAFSKKPDKKMSYYRRLIEILMATTIAFGGDCELPEEKDSYCYAENPVFIKGLSEYIKEYINSIIAEIDR